jgi:hypothetical protein
LCYSCIVLYPKNLICGRFAVSDNVKNCDQRYLIT